MLLAVGRRLTGVAPPRVAGQWVGSLSVTRRSVAAAWRGCRRAEMPEAARFSASSGTESDPECPMESESAIESSRRRRKKEKKEKKSKRHDKSRRRKTQMDESEQSEDDIDPPKLKKSRSGVKQNGHTRDESPENAKLSSLNNKSGHKKRHSNSSETSSGDGDSEPEQVKLMVDLVMVIYLAFYSCVATSLNLEQVIFLFFLPISGNTPVNFQVLKILELSLL